MTLRSSEHDVIEANDVFGEATDDQRLLRYCGEHGHVLVTHDRTDLAGKLTDTVDHAGIPVYTVPTSFVTTRRAPSEHSSGFFRNIRRRR